MVITELPLLQETEIDAKLDVLIALIYSGDATPEQKREYEELSRRRLQLMQPQTLDSRRYA